MRLDWGMTSFSTINISQAIERLLHDIGLQTEPSVEALDLPRLEKTARALCGQLKALENLAAYNAQCAATAHQQSYTSYEDLPPLSPEDRDRFEQKLIRLLDPEGLEEPEHNVGKIPEGVFKQQRDGAFRPTLASPCASASNSCA